MPLSQTSGQDVQGAAIVDTRQALTPSAPSSVTVGTSSALALAANASRRGLVLTNLSVGTISLGFGATAVLNTGISLYPGGIFVMDEYLFNVLAVNAISSIAGATLAIQELT